MESEVILLTREPYMHEPNNSVNICPRCGFEAPEGVRVCWRCGERLIRD